MDFKARSVITEDLMKHKILDKICRKFSKVFNSHGIHGTGIGLRYWRARVRDTPAFDTWKHQWSFLTSLKPNKILYQFSINFMEISSADLYFLGVF